MVTRLQRLAIRTAHRPWFRASMFSVLAVAVALLAKAVEGYMPEHTPLELASNAVGTILGVLASSLLAVTIFSLNTFVSALATATANVTPRATHLLQGDSTAQNAMATFLGAFLFSLVGLIALNTGFYGERGRVVLFLATIAMVVLVATTLLRWIDHVTHFGRVAETAARVEEAACDALADRARQPFLGGLDLATADADAVERAKPINACGIGYLQHVDMRALEELAADCAGYVYVQQLPGALVDPSRTLACVSGEPPEDVAHRVRSAFTVEQVRTFDQDPRFGVIVLAEIASRAMSPAVNDPGTAIDVIGRCLRVLAGPHPDPDPPSYRRVYAPGLDAGSLVEDAFAPIGRDAAVNPAVGLRLQKALLVLARSDTRGVATMAVRQSRRALALAEQAIRLDEDLAPLRAVSSEAVSAALRPRA